ncbi:Aminotransferase, class V/Cysteine desulfurase [Kalmanozyma brasiliensis GHG001]|uniref:Aminotransferase class V domain-containing protein n=1 Tax=Kalmanozyma brasiliensis (strain GHG001) TaxID=1365824 RepID=V5EQ82_KALBG|nr:Aminotransferase, class V/Cysteine desulfurase [Kalmanozyma brasiliensis GHG001]EST05078.1 Aminotransferase, class V/Cysteine desulfurase [Kalmanozyma brasiliensis GHG001]
MLAHLKALRTTHSTPLSFPDALTYHQDKSTFISSHPAYPSRSLHTLRRDEFSRLDTSSAVYLDYTGSALPPSSLLTTHLHHLRSSVLGNPHSTSPAALLSSASADEARAAVLEFFHADPTVYDVVWTANASAGVKIVGETYNWSGRRVVLPRDAHNSINSLARRAEAHGGSFEFVDYDGDSIPRGAYIETLTKGEDKGMVFFTGQSNITGAKLDLTLLQQAKSLGWDVGLDAAALAPSTRISLRDHRVDFMVVSLYKICGYPTGLGALILRKDAYAKLTRKETFFGGNIVGITMDRMEFSLVDGPERFEDGTCNFASLSAVKPGLEFAAKWMGPVVQRNQLLMQWLVAQLESIYYPPSSTREHEREGEKRLSSSTASTAAPPVKLVRLPNPSSGEKGMTLPLVLSSRENHALNYRFVIWAAAQENISLRGGPCMCNPGASSSVMQRGIITDLAASTLLAEADVGIVRVSLGIATNFKDVWRLVRFVRRLTDDVWVDGMWKVYARADPGARLSNDVDELHALATRKR